MKAMAAMVEDMEVIQITIMKATTIIIITTITIQATIITTVIINIELAKLNILKPFLISLKIEF